MPGLARTLLVSTLAECLSLEFHRIQFTPDLMPSDITGTEVLHEDRGTGERQLKYMPGPIFANIVLADEINRTPPKTQAALLEAMQERQVTSGGNRHALPDPFFVLATQNPIEQEGTYPLPEAQLDRFLFKVFVGYPSRDEERLIYRLTTGQNDYKPSKVLDGSEDSAICKRLVRRVPVSDHCVDYAMSLVRATRAAGSRSGSAGLRSKWIALGCGSRVPGQRPDYGKGKRMREPRSKDGNVRAVTLDDIRAVAKPVLRHRLQMTTYSAQSEGQSPDTIIEALLREVAARPGVNQLDGQVAQADSDPEVLAAIAGLMFRCSTELSREPSRGCTRARSSRL